MKSGKTAGTYHFAVGFIDHCPIVKHTRRVSIAKILEVLARKITVGVRVPSQVLGNIGARGVFVHIGSICYNHFTQGKALGCKLGQVRENTVDLFFFHVFTVLHFSTFHYTEK